MVKRGSDKKEKNLKLNINFFYQGDLERHMHYFLKFPPAELGRVDPFIRDPLPTSSTTLSILYLINNSFI